MAKADVSGNRAPGSFLVEVMMTTITSRLIAYARLAQLTGRLIHRHQEHVSTLGLTCSCSLKTSTSRRRPRNGGSHQRVLNCSTKPTAGRTL